MKKNEGLLIHNDIILDSNSTISKFRKKIISIKNEEEVPSKKFWTLNLTLFLISIVVVTLLILAYKKFYNRYRIDPQQSYISFFNRKKYGC